MFVVSGKTKYEMSVPINATDSWPFDIDIGFPSAVSGPFAVVNFHSDLEDLATARGRDAIPKSTRWTRKGVAH